MGSLELAGGLALKQQIYATWSNQETLPSGFTGQPGLDAELHATARSLGEQSLAIKREQGDRPGVAQALAHLGHVVGLPLASGRAVTHASTGATESNRGRATALSGESSHSRIGSCRESARRFFRNWPVPRGFNPGEPFQTGS